MIKEDGTILYFSGRTGRFLEPSPGRANLNIFNMARQGLKSDMYQAVKSVRLGQKECIHRDLRVKSNGGTTMCNLRVVALHKPEELKGLIMVIFEEITMPKHVQKTDKSPSSLNSKDKGRINELEEELASVKEHLQSTIEELETSNEELQSANEELQSTNEELETSREELQSVNEELMTVNAEAQERIERLTRATNDMRNLLNSTRIATIFLDLDLRVRSFTPAALRIFKFIQADIGRPITDIVNALCYDKLYKDMQQVLENLVPKEKQLFDNSGAWYLMKIQPYRTQDHKIDGIVVTFIDISKQKHVEAALSEPKDVREAILDQTGQGLVLIDRYSGSIVDTNFDFLAMVDRQGWELEELKIWDLMSKKNSETIRKLFETDTKQSLRGPGRMTFQCPDSRQIEVISSGKEITIGEREYLHLLVTREEKQA